MSDNLFDNAGFGFEICRDGAPTVFLVCAEDPSAKLELSAGAVVAMLILATHVHAGIKVELVTDAEVSVLIQDEEALAKAAVVNKVALTALCGPDQARACNRVLERCREVFAQRHPTRRDAANTRPPSTEAAERALMRDITDPAHGGPGATMGDAAAAIYIGNELRNRRVDLN